MKYRIIYIALIFLGMIGCLEEPTPPTIIDSLEDGAELLNYFETNGDFINSPEMPSLVTVEDVFNNSSNYLIVDVRKKEQYALGNIDGSIQKDPHLLVSFLDSINYAAFDKIVLVSRTGEASSFYNCLLRLLGYSNTYSMKFGMAMWNSDFASIFLGSNYWTTGNYNWQDLSGAYLNFNDVDYEPGNYNSLPSISYSQNGLDINGKINDRIMPLFNLELKEREINKFSSLDDLTDNSVVNCSFESIYQNYNSSSNSFDGIYLMFYGPNRMYRPLDYPKGFTGILPNHPPASVWYSASPDPSITSLENLQTIPNDKLITVCSTSGIISAFVTAYLRTMGYNAKSISFGASYFQHDTLYNRPNLREYLFREDAVQNYPYIVGED